jgi:hypothetical protein
MSPFEAPIYMVVVLYGTVVEMMCFANRLQLHVECDTHIVVATAHAK